MENKMKEQNTVDLSQVALALWKRVWLIALVGLVCAAIGFSLAAFVIAPRYSATVMLYVNNRVQQGTGSVISSSDISAAQSLVRTYGEILNNRTTMERVIAESGVSYTYRELSKKISSAPANDTEIMKVTVTTNDPDEAAKIANAIAKVLPDRVEEIIDGASMRIVEEAIPNPEKVGPSIPKMTLIAMLIGVLLSVAAVSVAALLDDTVHDEEYVIRTYGCPVLAKVPDLAEEEGRGYGYYRSRKTTKQGGEKA